MDTKLSIAHLAGLYANLGEDTAPFKKELSRLLQKKDFLPDGGVLGFGLERKYTYSETDANLRNSDIAGLEHHIVGTDKILNRIGTSLDLKTEFKVVYKMKDYPGISIMATTLSPFPNEAYPLPPTWENKGSLEGLCSRIGGDLIELSNEWKSEEEITKVEWVTPIKHINIMPEFIVKEEGKSVVSHIRGSYVMIMTVPEWHKRKMVGVVYTKAVKAKEGAAQGLDVSSCED